MGLDRTKQEDEKDTGVLGRASTVGMPSVPSQELCTQKDPVPGFMLLHCRLEILNSTLWKRVLNFHFVLGLSNYLGFLSGYSKRSHLPVQEM